MNIRIDLQRLERHIAFCASESSRLRKMHAGAPWAQRQADTFDDLKEFLLEVRRDHQMRGINGTRIGG